MKKAILILIVVLIAGCSGTAQQNTTPDIFVGFDGIHLEFAKNGPPPKVFEKSSFPVLMRIRNIGAYGIGEDEGALSISLEKDYVQSFLLEKNSRASIGDKDQILFSVAGRSDINPRGDEVLVALKA